MLTNASSGVKIIWSVGSTVECGESDGAADLEEEERHDGGRLGGNGLREVEGSEDGRGVQEGGEEGEDGEDVDLGDGKHFGGVKVVPVAEFVREDGLDFVCLTLLNERIEDDDVLALSWTSERERTGE
jgi:hypothetical protein